MASSEVTQASILDALSRQRRPQRALRNNDVEKPKVKRSPALSDKKLGKSFRASIHSSPNLLPGRIDQTPRGTLLSADLRDTSDDISQFSGGSNNVGDVWNRSKRSIGVSLGPKVAATAPTEVGTEVSAESVCSRSQNQMGSSHLSPSVVRTTRAAELRKLKTALVQSYQTSEIPAGRPVVPELSQLLQRSSLSQLGISPETMQILATNAQEKRPRSLNNGLQCFVNRSLSYDQSLTNLGNRRNVNPKSKPLSPRRDTYLADRRPHTGVITNDGPGLERSVSLVKRQPLQSYSGESIPVSRRRTLFSGAPEPKEFQADRGSLSGGNLLGCPLRTPVSGVLESRKLFLNRSANGRLTQRGDRATHQKAAPLTTRSLQERSIEQPESKRQDEVTHSSNSVAEEMKQSEMRAPEPSVVSDKDRKNERVNHNPSSITSADLGNGKTLSLNESECGKDLPLSILLTKNFEGENTETLATAHFTHLFHTAADWNF